MSERILDPNRARVEEDQRAGLLCAGCGGLLLHAIDCPSNLERARAVREIHPDPIMILIPGRPEGPNKKWAHWRLKAEHNASWRHDAKLQAIDVVNRMRWRAPDRARMVVTFHLPDSTRRDLDNLIGSTKPLLDGLVDARVLRDDSLRHLVAVTYRWRISPSFAGTEFEVHALLEGQTEMDLWQET